jgi:drug/metabolite transporter (DMT)-like permease
MLLACSNAVIEATRSESFKIEAVGDLAPAGVILAALVLHLARHRPWGPSDRLLVLALGVLGGGVAGAVWGLAFRPSPLAFTTAPVFLVAWAWFEAQAMLSRPHRLAPRTWPIDVDKKGHA